MQAWDCDCFRQPISQPGAHDCCPSGRRCIGGKGVLHPVDIGALYGPSGVGKTFAAIDLAYHIAQP